MTGRFSGKVGYVDGTVETAPGVWTENMVEVLYFGDVLRNTRQLLDGQKVNDDLTVNNNISIVADPYANEHFFNMRYVVWAGAYWKVTNVSVQSPRLLLTLGGVYDGPKASPPSGP